MRRSPSALAEFAAGLEVLPAQGRCSGQRLASAITAQPALSYQENELNVEELVKIARNAANRLIRPNLRSIDSLE